MFTPVSQANAPALDSSSVPAPRRRVPRWFAILLVIAAFALPAWAIVGTADVVDANTSISYAGTVATIDYEAVASADMSGAYINTIVRIKATYYNSSNAVLYTRTIDPLPAKQAALTYSSLTMDYRAQDIDTEILDGDFWVDFYTIGFEHHATYYYEVVVSTTNGSAPGSPVLDIDTWDTSGAPKTITF